MMNDKAIYNDIGQILFNIAPENSKQIIMSAELSPENDHCRYQYDYIDKFGEKKQFTGGGRAGGDILDCLVKLRKFYIENNLTNGKPIWHGCEVIVDLEKNKIHVDFKYD